MKRALVLCSVLALFGTGACGSNSGKSRDANAAARSATTAPTPTPTPAAQALKVWQTKPPWPLADRQADRIAEAGLPTLTAEGSHVHFHAHLDVFDNGEAVKVPAGVGIDFVRQVISPLHTHFDSGIIHVESNTDEAVTLGQFLTEWGVRVADDCIGDVCPPNPAALYVNGAKQTGPINEFVLRPNLQLALILGTPPPKIPATYDCSQNPQDACDQIPQP